MLRHPSEASAPQIFQIFYDELKIFHESSFLAWGSLSSISYETILTDLRLAHLLSTLFRIGAQIRTSDYLRGIKY
jgi:hypothetical protein